MLYKVELGQDTHEATEIIRSAKDEGNVNDS